VTRIRFDCATADAELFVDLMASTVHEVVLNGRPLTAEQVRHDDGLALPGVVHGPNVLSVIADCAYTDTGEGMHRFVDAADQQTYLYTQFEVADARRVFACFDQPDLKARFRFTVTAPVAWTVVSNTAPLTVDERDGSTVWRFAETPPLSTYVVSLAAGPYHAVHATHRIDDRFGHPYPFDRYDQLFVPGIQRGRHGEGRGRDPQREVRLPRQGVRGRAAEAGTTILHELSHMWFGDLVTMAW